MGKSLDTDHLFLPTPMPDHVLPHVTSDLYLSCTLMEATIFAIDKEIARLEDLHQRMISYVRPPDSSLPLDRVRVEITENREARKRIQRIYEAQFPSKPSSRQKKKVKAVNESRA
jgi:hypothetical protein